MQNQTNETNQQNQQQGVGDRPNHKTASRQKTSTKIEWLAKAGLLSGLAILLMYFAFPLPLLPGFLTFDFSEVIVLLAGFTLGPIGAVMTEAVKNISHLPATFTGGIGELANFLIGLCFVLPPTLIYRRQHTKRGAVIGLSVGIVGLVVSGVVINYFLTLPIYFKLMPLENIIYVCKAAGNTLVTDKFSLILFVFVPFNLVKGFLVSFVTFIMYKRIRPLLQRKSQKI